MDTRDPVLRFIPSPYRSSVVLAAGLMCMLSYGVVYSFGNLLPYLVSYMRMRVSPSMSSGSMIWLQTVMNGVPFSMLVGGILERKLGGRIAALIGTFVYTSSIAASFYTIQLSFSLLLISFGVCSAFGSGLAYNAILITAQRWLPENVGLAGGVIVGGYGCGAFILSPLQTAFINPLNYRPNEDGYFTQEDLIDRVPYVFLVMAAMFTVFQVVGLIFLGDPTEELSIEEEPLIGGAPPSEHTLSELVCSSTFAVLFLTLVLNSMWCQLTSGLYKTFGQQFVHSDFFLSLVGSFASVFNCVSRVLWGIAADKSSYQATMAMACALGASLMWLLPAVKAVAEPSLFMLTICLMFICVGGTYSLLPFATHKCFGKNHFGVIYGLVQMSLTIAGVLTGFMSQFILPSYGYEVVFLIGGSFMCLSFVLTSLIHHTSHSLIEEIETILSSRRSSVRSERSEH